MSRNIFYRIIWLGVLSWLIPFAISLLCYTPDGELKMEYSTFKSLMTISGTISGSYLLYHIFKLVNDAFILNGFFIGLSWFAINILLDSVVLIPIMKVPFPTYFMSIGLGYISIPAISVAMGYLLNRKLNIN